MRTTPVTRFVLKRLGLALITLFLLSVIVFAVSNDPARQRRSVGARAVRDAGVGRRAQRAARHQPAHPRRSTSTGRAGSLHGDLGTSLHDAGACLGSARPALVNSLEARARRVPDLHPALDPRRRSSRGASLRQARPTRGSRSPGSRSPRCRSSSPGIVLILVFGIWLGWLPVTAQSDRRRERRRRRSSTCSSRPSRSRSCCSATSPGSRGPAMIEALDTDYTRTAYLKGLPSSRRHSPARAAERAAADDRRRRGPDRLPLRRARGRRGALQLPGHRPPHLRCGAVEGPPAADGRRPPGRHRLPRRHAHRRPPLRAAQPAHPLRERRVSTARLADADRRPGRGASGSLASACVCCCARRLDRRRAIVIAFWIFCALLPAARLPVRPDLRQPLRAEPAAELGASVRHRHERSRRLLARARRLAQHPPRSRPRRRSSATVLGTSSAFSPATSAASSTTSRAGSSTPSSSLPLIVTAILDRHRGRELGHVGRDARDRARSSPRSSRAPSARPCSARRELDYVQAARLRGERAHYIMFSEILPNVMPLDRRRVHGPARLRDLRRRLADVPRLRRRAPVARLGGADLPVLHAHRSRTGG